MAHHQILRCKLLAIQAELDRAQAGQDRQQAAIDRQEFRSEIRQIWQYLRDGTASAADIATVVVAHLIIDGLRRSDACGERSYRVQG
ncbi:MAG: hypothetical protein ACFKPT_05880 [Gloeotrichia echinulata GP01]